MSTQQQIEEFDDQIDTPVEFRVDTAIFRTKAPMFIGIGFVALFGGLMYRGRAGRSSSYMFGEARVKAQMTAVVTLMGFGLYHAITDDNDKTKKPQ